MRSLNRSRLHDNCVSSVFTGATERTGVVSPEFRENGRFVSPEFRENGLDLCHQNFERTDWVCVTRISRERTGFVSPEFRENGLGLCHQKQPVSFTLCASAFERTNWPLLLGLDRAGCAVLWWGPS